MPGTAGRSLAAQTNDLPVDQARRNRHVKRAAIRQRQALVRTRDRLRKIDRQLVMQIPSTPVGARSFATSQKLGESVVRIHEIGITGIIGIGTTMIRRGEIAVVTLLRPLCTCLVDLAGVEAFALLRIAQEIIGHRDFLELFFGRLVPGIEIGVKLFRQLAVRLLDIGG